MKKIIKDLLLALLISLLAVILCDQIFQISRILFNPYSINQTSVLLSFGGKALFVAMIVLGFIGLRILRGQREIKHILLEQHKNSEEQDEKSDSSEENT